MESLLQLIKENEEYFLRTVKYRQSTSVHNKEIHQKMIDSINVNDYDTVLELLNSSNYLTPLSGIIYCLDGDYYSEDWELKSKFIEAFEK